MKSKVKNLSNLIDTQLPNFILSEYPNFSAFLQKYYEELELPGHPVDIINNLTKYRDIDTYEKKLLNDKTTLSSEVLESDDVIYVDDTSSFPEFNGYVLIDDEIIFYKYKTTNSFVDCYRNVSATTKLGDLYDELEFNSVDYTSVGNGRYHNNFGSVHNVSHLFLYALVKNFESEYLGPFPENLLKPDVDRSLLIKNIKKFYAAKGTDKSIQFIFSSLISKSSDDIPTVYYPKDYTIKASNGEWSTKYSLKAKILSGDPQKIVGSIISEYKDGSRIAYGVIDNVVSAGNGFHEIIFSEGSVNGKFTVSGKTVLRKNLSSSSGENSRIYVESTSGFEESSILLNGEIIDIKSKNATQFIIKNRGSLPVSSNAGKEVFENKIISVKELENSNNSVNLIILGVISNVKVENAAPYFSAGDDIVELTETTKNRIVFDKSTNNYRWIINENLTAPIFNSVGVLSNPELTESIAGVSSLYEDSDYFYIASSGYPYHSVGKSSWNFDQFVDKKVLRLIPKTTKNSTEFFETPTSDVGIFINGVLAHSYKEEEVVNYGEVVKIEVTNKGVGYKNPPYVLLETFDNTISASAVSVLSGEVVDKIIIKNPGGKYTTAPKVTVTSGRNAKVSAVVTLGRVTSLKIDNPGEYYSSAPEIRIIDKNGTGRFAKYKALVDNGAIIGFEKEDEGRFYTPENIIVEVIPDGSGATAVSSIRSWTKNKFKKYSSIIDENNGFYYGNSQTGYGYAYLANPVVLRDELGDDGVSHSPILGFAYDGNPIYGPYGYSDPIDAGSSVSRMTSSYGILSSREGGPSKSQYPMGTFVEDYSYSHKSGSLDENNGRFCVTPEYPEGTYAYFLTVDQQDKPVFPYILGKNYYSLPLEINYKNNINQDLLPKKARRLQNQQLLKNGNGEKFSILDVYSGKVDGIDVYNSAESFSAGGLIYSEDSPNVLGKISEIEGKQVISIDNRQIQAVKISTKNTCYLFAQDTITQPFTGATGILIGNVFDSQTLVLRNVSGEFDLEYPIESSIPVISTILDKPSSFTRDATIRLVNGKKCIIKSVSSNKINVSLNPFTENESITFTNDFSNIESGKIYYVVNRQIKSFQISESANGSPLSITTDSSVNSIAEGEKSRGVVLESVEDRNNVRIRVNEGTFAIDSNYYLSSSVSTDTILAKITSVLSLSSNIELSNVNDNIALVTTAEDHGLSEGDIVNVDILPNDSLTETVYYVRRKLYQKLKVNAPTYNSFLNDTGVGRLIVLNNGSYRDTSGEIVGDYANGLNDTFTNVELIFLDENKSRTSLGKEGDVNNAKATINVTNGVVSSIVITNKGSGYKKGDLLTVTNESLERLPSSVNSAYLIVEVDHVGLSKNETIVNIGSSNGLSENDLILIGNEVVKVIDIISSKKIEVLRAQENTESTDHFNFVKISNYSSSFKLSKGYNPQNKDFSFVVESYDPISQELLISYDSGVNINNAIKVSLRSRFLDQSVPQKSFEVLEILEDLDYYFQFSKDAISWSKNPTLYFKNNYRYTFDLSNSTLKNCFFELSPCVNYNILTYESDSSSILPGNSGSFYSVKFGYGNNIATNTFDVKKSSTYNTYYYFDKSGNTKSENSFIKIITDPLQGTNLITYVTSNRFVYDLNETTDHDGSGTITYSTNSSTAEGKIKSAVVLNTDVDLKNLPVVYGITPAPSNECIVEATVLDGKIESTNIIFTGKNYINPKIYVLDITGKGAKFKVNTNEIGEIVNIIILNSGSNYSNGVKLKVVESSSEAYYYSNSIGKPKIVKILSNGYDFNSDLTLKRKYTSYTILSIKNIQGAQFYNYQYISQYKDGELIASGYVVPDYTKEGSNIIKLYDVQGTFEENLEIQGQSNQTAVVVKVFSCLFDGIIESDYSSSGQYVSGRSHLNNNYQKIADSYFYQDYSYIIRSKTPINVWRKIITDTVHPAGFKVFGDLLIESESIIPPATKPIISSHTSFIQLWDDNYNKITVEKVTKRNTVSVVSLKNINEQRGKGFIAAPYVDTSDTLSLDLKLVPEFDGYFDESGNREGTKTFTMIVAGSNPVSNVNVYNKNNLIISLDGILQEPDNSYTINESQITFDKAPLGYRNSSGQSINSAQFIDGVDVPKQNFVGRFISIKNASENFSLFKKLSDISSQFDGITREFDLYYENGSPAELQIRENLIVSIDGIIQRSGETPLFPRDRAYYIRRNVTPNRIVFVDPPKPETKFFGYSIGNYYRVKLGLEITDDNNGIFPLRTEYDNRTFVVDNERNLLVFIDGVLQTRGKSYTLPNNFIKFTEPLTPGQKVYMLFCYGSDSDRSLTTFDYSDNLFDKEYTITINTSVIAGSHVRNVLTGRYVYSVDDNDNPLWNTAAKIISYKYVSGNTWQFVLRTRSTFIDSTKPFAIQGFAIFAQTDLVSVSDYERNSSGYATLRKYIDSRYEYLEVDDFIKIDGENSYRQIKESPSSITEYDNFQYFGKFKSSNNNDILPGVTISAEPIMDNTSVVGINWIGEKMPNYLDQNNSSFVGRANLIFIPQPVLNEGGEIISLPTGGGASGYVFFNENKVVNCVITNSGSGYLVPPKIYVALGYDIKKSVKNVIRPQINSVIPSISSESFASFSAPQLDIDFRYKGQGEVSATARASFGSGVTTISLTAISGLIIIGQQLTGLGIAPGTIVLSFTSTGSTTGFITISIPTTSAQTNVTLSFVAKIFAVEGFILNDVSQTFNDILISNYYSASYGNIEGKNAVISLLSPYLSANSLSSQSAKINLSFESSVDTTQKVSPNQQDSKSIVITYNVSLLDNTKIQTGGAINFAAAYTDLAFDTDDTVLYVATTSNFTDSGYLLIGTEIVYYTSKLPDRFIISERGAYNSPISNHNPGSYLRQYVPDISNIDTTIANSVSYQTYSISTSPASINVEPITISVVTKSSAADGLNVSGSEVRIERNAQITTASEDLNVDLQEINKIAVTDIIPVGLNEITVQSTVISVGGRLEDLAIDVEPVFGGVAKAFRADDEEVTKSTFIQSVLANITSVQEITVIPGIEVPDNSLNVSLQSVLISVGGRQQDLAVDVLPVFGGVAKAFSIAGQDVTSSVIVQSVLANITSVQEITVTPYVIESNASIISGESIVFTTTIDQPLDDSGSIEYQSELNAGVQIVSEVASESITTSVIVQSVLANITSVQEITVTPYVEDSEVTVASITAISTDSTSEGEVVFIQTDTITSQYIAAELGVEVVETEITPIIVPKVLVDTIITSEININQQLVLDQQSVISITPNEVIANDINDIQIYRTIETGLGANGAGVSVLGEYPYQSELMNVSPQNIINEVNLVQQQIIDIDITSIQEITVIPPANVNNTAIVTVTSAESIIVTTTIDIPLEDNSSIEYQSELYVGVSVSPVDSSNNTVTTSFESKILADIQINSQVIGFYDSLRTTQTSLEQDPEAFRSPVAITVDDVITNIDKPINAQNVPIEPIAAVRLTAPDPVIITNIVIPDEQLIDIYAWPSNILSIKISPQVPTGVDADNAITTVVTTIIDKGLDSLQLQNTLSSEVTVTRSTGVLDYYQESLYINNDISTRSDGIITITDYQITTNSDGTITARNITETQQFNRYGTYGIGSLMVSHATVEYNAFFNNVGDDNTVVNTTYLESGASGMGIDEFTRMYPGTTIEDFESRTNSRISKSGDTLNIGISTYTSVELGANNKIEDDKILPE